MVPRVSSRGAGRSFYHAGLYYLHDKREDGQERSYTSERVEFTHAENVPASDDWQALHSMYRTWEREKDIKAEAGVSTTGQRCQRPVFTTSLSWAIGEEPDKEHMIETARAYQASLDMQEHEALYVAHNDEAYSHIHLILNRVHPETGRVADLRHTKLKASAFARDYEREHGIHCEQREENWAKREQGEFVKHRERATPDRDRITELYRQSETGRAFAAALREEGYELADGGRRMLIVDRNGKQYNLARQVDGAKARDIREKLADVELRKADEVAAEVEARRQRQKEQDAARDQQQERSEEDRRQEKEREAKAEPEAEYWDREEDERRRMEEMEQAAIDAEEARLKQERKTAWSDDQRHKRRQERDAGKTPQQLNREQDARHAKRRAFSDQIWERRREVERYLEESYGASERDIRAEIQELEAARFERGKAAQTLHQLRGRERADQQRLEALNKNLENIEWRKSEYWTAFENDKRRREEQFRFEMEREFGPEPGAAQQREKPAPEPAREVESAPLSPEPQRSPKPPAPPRPEPSRDWEKAARRDPANDNPQERKPEPKQDRGPERDMG